MYHFAVVALLGLAVLKVADLLEDFVPGLARMNALLTYVLAVAAAVALDYSVFRGFHIPVRDAWMGSWFTGFIIGLLSPLVARPLARLLGWPFAHWAGEPGKLARDNAMRAPPTP